MITNPYTWSGTPSKEKTIIDVINENHMRNIRNCECVVAPDEVENVEFILRCGASKEFNDYIEEVKKNKINRLR